MKSNSWLEKNIGPWVLSLLAEHTQNMVNADLHYENF